MQYHLAIDIGAFSGRYNLGWLENGKMKPEEVYRFENGLSKKNSRLCLNMYDLLQKCIARLTACKQAGKILSTLGIDTGLQIMCYWTIMDAALVIP